MSVHPGLLTQFGKFEGRRSRIFTAAAIVGSADADRCALVTAASAELEHADYHLVHVLPITAKAVDRVPDPLARSDEYRLYSWHMLHAFLTTFSNGATDAELANLACRSAAHLSAV